MKRNSIIFDPALAEVDMHPVSRTEALGILVGKLQKLGYVNEKYLEQVINREEEFPTGLAFEHISVALPHANPEDVYQSACVIGRCLKPVNFGCMEAPEKELPVELICVLALNNPNQHLTLLSKLMELFSDKKQIENIRGAKSKEELCKIFTDSLEVHM